MPPKRSSKTSKGSSKSARSSLSDPTNPVKQLIVKLATKNANLQAVKDMQEQITNNRTAVEPYLVTYLGKILDVAGDKPKKEEVQKTVELLLLEGGSPFGISKAMKGIIHSLGNKAKPSQKELTLHLIIKLAKKEPALIGKELHRLVPAVTDLMNAAQKEVTAAARLCMETIGYCTGNSDLEPFIPFVLEAVNDLSKADKCVEKLASCVFVQNVEGPALAITIPVLQRGLRDRNEELKRTCCVIIDNMCKLVEDPKEVEPLMPQLEPLVRTASESIADPEARGVAEKALKSLTKAAGEGQEVKIVTRGDLRKVVGATLGGTVGALTVIDYVACCALAAGLVRNFNPEDWKTKVTKFLPNPDVAKDLPPKIEKMFAFEEEEEEDDGEGKELYKGSFSLAYGTLTLLRDAKMNLKWHKFYGLLGPNNCGKTTMMRAIANEQLEGFPTRAELLSVFVEHEIEEREVGVKDDGFPILNTDLSGINWIIDTIHNVYKLDIALTEDKVREQLHTFGFGKDRAADPDGQVTSYSGGWKMKMQLLTAYLMNVDVLMLDEPTGHMDVDNQKWLRDWLRAFPGTIICTSHDSKFLDEMCDYIIDFQDRKLKIFKGDRGSCLSAFVAKYPEKKGYFELKNDVQKYVFPAPGPLEGIKSRTKLILKMQDVTFTYPGKDKPVISNINLTVSQVSRVAVIGANGAGKSTAIKVLVGELVAQQGTVWKAPGMRMAYVAQHAFHHVESHLDKTPCAYIMWRFAGNEDRESLEFKGDELSANEEELRAVQWILDPVRMSVRKWETEKENKHIVVPDAIQNRRINKKEKTKEYEVKWQFKDLSQTFWVPRETLIRMGYIKMVQREDEKQAAMAGLQTKHLTTKGVEEHLGNYGLDGETAAHTAIRHLSGGQKVKVVIGAAMWQNPHMLILDEPTNYLDRDGLGALTLAIRDFLGGVLIISHNREFCDGCCQEKWIMQGGRLRIEGESYDPNADKEGEGNVVKEDVLDAAGNIVEMNVSKNLSDKDKKKQIKLLEKKLKDNKKSNLMSENEIWEIDDEIAALKESMAK